MKGVLDSLARWPLLLGAVILYALAVWEETQGGQVAVAFGALIVGSVLLGAWVWSLAIEAERRHRRDPPQ